MAKRIQFYEADDNDDNDHNDDDDDDDVQMGSTICQVVCKEMGFDDGNTH